MPNACWNSERYGRRDRNARSQTRQIPPGQARYDVRAADPAKGSGTGGEG